MDIDKKDIVEIVKSSAKEAKAREVKDDTMFYGNEGVLDSLSLVIFSCAIEDNIEKKFGKNIKIDEDAGINFIKDNMSVISQKIYNLLTLKKKPYRKLVIVDLDNTLWEGIVGDDGYENIKIYGPFLEIQKQLKDLVRKGILLAISSKNTERIALEAISKHPDMILKLEDFIEWSINWEEKYKGIIDICKKLNLGLESVVFIDDSPVERDRVKQVLPEVEVSDKLDISLFNLEKITEEDRNRLSSYKAEKNRQEIKISSKDFKDWVFSLELELTYDIISYKNIEGPDLDRIEQMFNKTNQMNLTTRRLNRQEIIDWFNYRKNAKMFLISVKDKFGDYGITGLVTFSITNDTFEIIDFILSCRVMGRGVEDMIFDLIRAYISKHKVSIIKATYYPTEKNGPCKSYFMNNNNFKSKELKNGKVIFEWLV